MQDRDEWCSRRQREEDMLDAAALTGAILESHTAQHTLGEYDCAVIYEHDRILTVTRLSVCLVVCPDGPAGLLVTEACREAHSAVFGIEWKTSLYCSQW